MNDRLPNGTLVSFYSGGSGYTGFIIGTCSYDNAGPDNAYVVRYVWKEEDDSPRKPYSIVAMKDTELVDNFPESFVVGGHWSATPEDRCDEWVLKWEDGRLMIIPVEE